jgi:anion-transporting  ArsA/GET3 family ATPase
MNLKDRSEDFAKLVADRRIIVCVGSGGVGKTTTSAVIGLQEAIRGRKVLVLTIDPARRLANSLGIEEIGSDMHRIPIERFEEVGLKPEGELWAMMLDMKESFDHVVRRYAPPEAQQEILDNRIYQYFSTSVAGTQEYAAAERLYELHEDEDFDLIVLDTPPTTHALDFLDAPTRLGDAIDNRALQWLYKPAVLSGRRGLGIFSAGTSYVMKQLAKFTGTQLLDEFSTFLRSFSVLFEGLKDRGRKVREVLTSDISTFVVVTAPDPLTIEEATYFYKKLGDESVNVGGFVVNRVHDFGFDHAELNRPAVAYASHLRELSDEIAALDDEVVRDLAERLLHNGKEFAILETIDEDSVHRLIRQIPEETPICTIPYFSTDVHSLEGLNLARNALFVPGE